MADLAGASVTLNFIKSKTSFLNWWQKNETETLERRSWYQKRSVQVFFVATVSTYMLYVTNAYFDLVPVTDWYLSIAKNPQVVHLSTEARQILLATGEIIFDKVVLKVGGASFDIVKSALFLGPPVVIVNALFQRLVKPWAQKAEVVSNKVFGNVSDRHTVMLDRWEDKVVQIFGNFKSSGANKNTQNRTDAEDDLLDVKNEFGPNSDRLSDLARMRRNLRVQGYRTDMTEKQYTKMLFAVKASWSAVYSKLLNTFTEFQRVARSHLWESIHFRPQHFFNLVTTANISLEVHLQGFENMRREIENDHRRHTARIRQIIIDQLVPAIEGDVLNEVRAPYEAEKFRAQIEIITEELRQMAIAEYQIGRLLSTYRSHLIARRAAATALASHLRHDIEYPEYSRNLPDDQYKQLLIMREGLGLDFYQQELSEQVVAIAEDLNLSISAHTRKSETLNYINSFRRASKPATVKKEKEPATTTGGSCDALLSSKK
jgi:hypothetical protein